MTEPKVYISYSHPDGAWARKFAQRLTELGLNAWFDQLSIPLGQDRAEATEKGLRESDIVVFLINQDNVNSPNLLFELGAALAMKKTIVPVISQDEPIPQLPFPLLRRQGLVRTSPEETAQEFARAIEAVSQEAA